MRVASLAWICAMPLLVLGGCGQTSGPASEYRKYRARMEQVVSRNIPADPLTRDIEAPFFRDPDIRHLYQHPYEHRDLAWQLLRDRDVAFPVRQYQAKLLRCLKLDDYLQLLEQARIAMEQHELDPELMFELASAGMVWGTELQESYKDERVRATLTAIAESPAATPHVTGGARDLLHGYFASYRQQFNGPDHPVPRMPCTPEKGLTDSAP